MNIEIYIAIISHIICFAMGYLLRVSIAKHNVKEIVIDNNISSQMISSAEKKIVPKISEDTTEKIRKIVIDTSKVVVNDIDNNFEKHFDTIGDTKTTKDNIMDVVNKLSQIKKNGGHNG